MSPFFRETREPTIRARTGLLSSSARARLIFFGAVRAIGNAILRWKAVELRRRPHVQRLILRKQYGKLGRFYLSHKFPQQGRLIVLSPDEVKR